MPFSVLTGSAKFSYLFTKKVLGWTYSDYVQYLVITMFVEITGQSLVTFNIMTSLLCSRKNNIVCRAHIGTLSTLIHNGI